MRIGNYLSGRGEPSGGYTIWNRPSTTIGIVLVGRKLNNYVTSKSENVVEIEMTSGCRFLSIDSHGLDICCGTLRNLLLYRCRIEVLDCDGGADIEVFIVDGILGKEW